MKNNSFWKPVKLTKSKPKPFSPVNLKKYPPRTKAETRLIDRKPFGDKDKDGVPNFFDCRPMNKKWQDVILYHGTTPKAAQQIKKEGLKTGHGINPYIYLTPNKQIARRYANEKGIVFQVKLSDEFAKKQGIPLKNPPTEVTITSNVPANKLKELNDKSYPVRTAQENLLIDKNPFGDTDKDGVMNMLDCKPLNRNKQDYIKNKKMLEKKAKKLFGTTKYIKETGYILTSGKKLNLGRGDIKKERSHSEVEKVFLNTPYDNPSFMLDSSGEERNIFLDKTRAIRYVPEYANVNIEMSYRGMSKKQKKVIKQALEENKKEGPGNIYYDILGKEKIINFGKNKFRNYPIVASGFTENIEDVEKAIKKVQEKYEKEKIPKPEALKGLDSLLEGKVKGKEYLKFKEKGAQRKRISPGKKAVTKLASQETKETVYRMNKRPIEDYDAQDLIKASRKELLTKDPHAMAVENLIKAGIYTRKEINEARKFEENKPKLLKFSPEFVGEPLTIKDALNKKESISNVVLKRTVFKVKSTPEKFTKIKNYNEIMSDISKGIEERNYKTSKEMKEKFLEMSAISGKPLSVYTAQQLIDTPEEKIGSIPKREEEAVEQLTDKRDTPSERKEMKEAAIEYERDIKELEEDEKEAYEKGTEQTAQELIDEA